jgi:hypothetical protein
MALTYTKIASVVFSSNASATLTFSSIPQTYTDLIVKLALRTTDGGSTTDGANFQFNGVSTNWTAKRLNAEGSTFASDSSTSDRNLVSNDVSSTANTFTNIEIYCPNYTSSNYKSISIDAVIEMNNTTNNYLRLGAGLWSNTAAVTSITVYNSGKTFAAGTTAYLYGITKA